MNRNRLSSNEVVMCYNTDEVDKLCTFLNLEKEYYIKQIQNKEWVGLDRFGEIYHAGCPNNEGKHLIRFRDIEPLLLSSANKEAVNHPSEDNDIRKVFDSINNMVQAKNKKYGGSALKPLDIFARHHGYGSRIDEKLARVKNSEELSQNDVGDIIGGLVLICKDKGWFDFEKFID